MAGHTGGPWEAHEDTVRSTRARANDGKLVAVCYGPDARANARLLAQAAELAEALRDMLVNHDVASGHHKSGGRDQWPEAARRAREALSRAGVYP